MKTDDKFNFFQNQLRERNFFVCLLQKQRNSAIADARAQYTPVQLVSFLTVVTPKKDKKIKDKKDKKDKKEKQNKPQPWMPGNSTVVHSQAHMLHTGQDVRSHENPAASQGTRIYGTSRISSSERFHTTFVF